MSYIRAVTDRTGVVTGEGRAVHVRRNTAVADARLVDPAGKV